MGKHHGYLFVSYIELLFISANNFANFLFFILNSFVSTGAVELNNKMEYNMRKERSIIVRVPVFWTYSGICDTELEVIEEFIEEFNSIEKLTQLYLYVENTAFSEEKNV